MEDQIKLLEDRRRIICQNISQLGDMRKGSLNEMYRQCNKSPCVCKKEGHPGHGPYYYWTHKENGRTVTRQFSPGPRLTKLQREIENYRRFRLSSEELVDVNNRLCELRPCEPVLEENAKKNSSKKSPKSSRRK